MMTVATVMLYSDHSYCLIMLQRATMAGRNHMMTLILMIMTSTAAPPTTAPTATTTPTMMMTMNIVMAIVIILEVAMPSVVMNT